MKNQLKALALMLGAAGLATSAAHAQDKVKIGFITDMSSLYADVEGKNGALAIQWGVLGDVLDRHLASSVAQRWDHPRTAVAVRKSVRSYERLLALVEAGRADDAAAHWREHTRVAGEVLMAGAGSTSVVDLFT